MINKEEVHVDIEDSKSNVRRLHKDISEIIISAMQVLVVSAFPVLYIYLRNVNLVSFGEISIYLLFIIIGALLAAAVLYFFQKSFSKSAILAGIFALLFLFYRFLEEAIRLIIPSGRYWHLMPVVIVIFIHIAYITAKKLSKDTSKKICMLLLITFGILLIFNVIMAAPDIVNKLQEARVERERVSNTDTTGGDIAQTENLPNIYFLMFDEYSGFEAIERVYGYSNSEFYEFLIENNFAVSRGSHNSYTLTPHIVANLIRLEYVVYPGMSDSDYHNLGDSPYLYTLMENHGYTLRGLGLTHLFYLPPVTVSDIFHSHVQTIEGYDIRTLLLRNTMLYPIINTEPISERRRWTMNTLLYLTEKDNIPEVPTFTFLFSSIPHQPFIFDRYGNAVHASNVHNWEDPHYFLGQFMFTTRLITEIVDFLITEDPDSIIILQSDHSARGNVPPGPTRAYDVRNILNAVYFRGEPFTEIDGLSGVNTLRVVFGKLLGIDMPILEVPGFAS